MTKPLIACLTTHKAKVDLLNDDCHLESRKRFVENDLRKIAAGLVLVTRNDFFSR